MNNQPFIKYLYTLLAEDTGEAIKAILEFAEDRESKLYLETIHQSARWNRSEKDTRKGTVMNEHASVERARIYDAVKHLIGEIGKLKEYNYLPANTSTKNNMNPVPASFIERLKIQINDQYQMIAEYTDLLRFTTDPRERRKYEAEIHRCHEDIKHIEKNFVESTHRTYPSVTPDELKNIVKEAVKESEENIVNKIEEHDQNSVAHFNKLYEKIMTGLTHPYQEVIAEVMKRLDEKEVRLIELMSEEMQRLSTDQATAIVSAVFECIDDLEGELKTKTLAVMPQLSSENLQVKLKFAAPFLDFFAIEAEVSLNDTAKSFWKSCRNRLRI